MKKENSPCVECVDRGASSAWIVVRRVQIGTEK